MTSEYWKNLTKIYTWPTDEDPIVESMHNGAHCLFYDPSVHKDTITYKQSLQDICDWANRRTDDFTEREKNFYDIANIVKLNMWVDDIRKQGIVKPMMLFYEGGEKLGINNGESRLRACTCIPTVTKVSGFISTRKQYYNKFSHLEEVTSFNQFANLCNAIDQQQYRFTLTDPAASYGIYWYEYNSAKTATMNPSQDYCVEVLGKYLQQHPDTVFSPEWFSQLVDWNHYKNC